MVTKSRFTRKSTKETVKTIRVRECRVISGATVVTNSRVLYFSREASAADLTFARLAPRVPEANVKSKAALEYNIR
jgi:hypothetical protein